MKPILIVVGGDDTMVYALGDVELYVIRPSHCNQLLLAQSGGPAPTSEAGFGAEPLTPHDFIRHAAASKYLHRLPATDTVVERLCEVDDERRRHGPGCP